MKNILYLFLALASCGRSPQTTAEEYTAQEYLISAVSRCYLNEWDGAIVDFTKAIEIEPNYIEAYRKREVLLKKH